MSADMVTFVGRQKQQRTVKNVSLLSLFWKNNKFAKRISLVLRTPPFLVRVTFWVSVISYIFRIHGPICFVSLFRWMSHQLKPFYLQKSPCVNKTLTEVDFVLFSCSFMQERLIFKSHCQYIWRIPRQFGKFRFSFIASKRPSW